LMFELPPEPDKVDALPLSITKLSEGISRNFLYNGSRFSGCQKSKGNSYDVEVIIQHCNLEEEYLCGYLMIKGLTDDYPHLTTFFHGEIIGEKHPFLTRKWDADEEIDRKHWSKFFAFNKYKKMFNSDNFDCLALKKDNHVFMRWKEQFLIPDYQVRDIHGASFAGFYYIALNLLNGVIEGYYYHKNSEWFQSLNLKYVPELTTSEDAMGLRDLNAKRWEKSLIARTQSNSSIVDTLVHMKCTKQAIAAFNFSLLTVIVTFLILSLGLDYWVYTIEPRTVNLTDDFGDYMEFLQIYHLGYWRICRESFIDADENVTKVQLEYLSHDTSSKYSCLFVMGVANADVLISFGVTSGAIAIQDSFSDRMLLMLALHFIALLLTFVGFGFTINGYLKSNKQSIFAAIIHIAAGICISVCIMQFVCVVEDEMSARVKPTAEGEPSKYKSYYGISFFLIATCFVLLHISTLAELKIFLLPYNSTNDMLLIVPGLKRRLMASVRQPAPLFYIPQDADSTDDNAPIVKMPMKSFNNCIYSSVNFFYNDLCDNPFGKPAYENLCY
ncbi:Glucose-induced degradation protein 4 -like protein, partial [Trichinella pseudospiralis]